MFGKNKKEKTIEFKLSDLDRWCMKVPVSIEFTVFFDVNGFKLRQ